MRKTSAQNIMKGTVRLTLLMIQSKHYCMFRPYESISTFETLSGMVNPKITVFKSLSFPQLIDNIVEIYRQYMISTDVKKVIQVQERIIQDMKIVFERILIEKLKISDENCL